MLESNMMMLARCDDVFVVYCVMRCCGDVLVGVEGELECVLGTLLVMMEMSIGLRRESVLDVLKMESM